MRTHHLQSTKLLLTTMMLLSLLAIPVMANSIPPLPNTFSGNVTLDGSEAPVGTTIKAYIDYQNDTEPDGSANITIDGHYEIHVQGNSADHQKEITFIIDDSAAVQTAEFSIYAPHPTVLDISTTGTAVKISPEESSIFSDTTNPEDKQVTGTSSDTEKSLNGFSFILAIGMLASVFLISKFRRKGDLQ
ncbi:hypothetical protein [Methanolobus sp. WCC5]|uniref:hypothetical protein n=1 Tax=Methanolobus sp. WCC5 TaxID=3125785 RepID=UPI003253234C